MDTLVLRLVSLNFIQLFSLVASYQEKSGILDNFMSRKAFSRREIVVSCRKTQKCEHLLSRKFRAIRYAAQLSSLEKYPILFLFRFYLISFFPSDGSSPGYVNQRASVVYFSSLWCRQSLYSVPREPWTEGAYRCPHSDIFLGFAYVVILLSFECNDCCYQFRVKQSSPFEASVGPQISLRRVKGRYLLLVLNRLIPNER